MHENIYEFLYQVMAVLALAISIMLFILVMNTTCQLKEAFLQAYTQQSNIFEGDLLSSAEYDWVKGSNIIFNIYYELDCPISIDGFEVPLGVDVSRFDFSIIDCNRKYKRIPFINETGKIIRVDYH